MKKLKSNFLLVLCFTLGASILSGCSFADFLSEAKEGIEEAGKTIKEKATEAFEWSKNAAVSAYGAAKDGAVYVYNNVADWSVNAYNTVSNKSKELIGDVSSYIKGLTEPKPLEIKETYDNNTSATAKSELFVPYYISSLLDNEGYKTYNGAIYYKDELLSGLIFSKNNVFLEEDDKKIYECGFVQLVNKGYSGILLDDNMIGTGLVAVSAKTDTEESKTFVVQEFHKFSSFSGIIDNTYFSYKPITNYALEIDFKENKNSNYDMSLPIYDFDHKKEINKVELSESELEKLYKSDKAKFEVAADGSNAVGDYIETQSNQNDALVVMDNGFVNSILDKIEDDNTVLESAYKAIFKKQNIGSSVVSSIDSNGQVNQVVSSDETNSERIASGLIETIGSGIGAISAVGAAVATVVFSTTAGVPGVAAIVITTATCSVVYNISNMIEGLSKVYYGGKLFTKASENPVLAAFKKLIPNESVATLVYHIWGISNTLLSGMMLPTAKALNFAKCMGYNVFKTMGAVARSSLVFIAKAAITGLASGVVYKYVDKILYRVTNNRALSKLVGFGSATIAAFLTYKGLNAFDQALNLSGYYVNTAIDANGIEHCFDDNQIEYKVNKQLKPNVTYTVKGYTYTTDGQGRIISANGRISLNEGERLPIKDKLSDIGRGSEQAGDDRGHIIGDQLGGSNGSENMIPQNASINRGEYAANENAIAADVLAGKTVDVEITLNYEGNSFRPVGIIYTKIVNGILTTLTFLN